MSSIETRLTYGLDRDVPCETSAIVRYRLKRRIRPDGRWVLMEEHEREFSSDDYDHPIEAAKDFKDSLLAEHGVDRPPPSDHPDNPETWRPCLASASAEPQRKGEAR